MSNAKDYTGQNKKFLVYGRTGAGKSASILTHPGRKFVYIFDPAGVETFAGYDVEYEYFVPDMKLHKGKLGKDSNMSEFLRPNPKVYLEFERDYEKKARNGFFDQYDLIAFESFSTLQDMLMWYILDAQGRGNSAPEIADYYYRADAMKNLVRIAAANSRIIYCSAHIVTAQDESTKRMETSLFLPKALRIGLPLMFSEVLHLFAETDKNGDPKYYAQFLPGHRMPDIRCSITGVRQQEDITIDWKKDPAGQGLFGLYGHKPNKTAEQLKRENTVKLG